MTMRSLIAGAKRCNTTNRSIKLVNRIMFSFCCRSLCLTYQRSSSHSRGTLDSCTAQVKINFVVFEKNLFNSYCHSKTISCGVYQYGFLKSVLHYISYTHPASHIMYHTPLGTSCISVQRISGVICCSFSRGSCHPR